MKRRLTMVSLALAASLALPSITRVSADQVTKIRLSTLAPPGSSWEKVFQVWGSALKKDTGGALELQLVRGGAAGDDRATLSKLKAAEVDAAGLTAVGLSQVARATEILQAPGLIETPAQLKHVREALGTEFEGIFDKAGYTLLGWADAGAVRTFAKKPIATPADLKASHPWVARDEQVYSELLKVIGVTGLPLAPADVPPAIQKGTIDSVAVSSLAALALNWFRNLSHVSKQTSGVIAGATLLRADVFKKLPPDQQKALLETGKKAHGLLQAQIQRDDDNAYKALLGRGLKEFDMYATPDQKKAWEAAHAEVIKRLTGKAWSKELLEQVKLKAKETK